MSDSAFELFQAIQAELAPRDDENRFVPQVSDGRAPLSALGALGAEELSIVDSDRRGFLLLAARSTATPAIDFYTNLAQGESLALAKLPAYLAACGWGETQITTYELSPGCQSYPAYVAWLAMNGDPVEVSLALLANFAAWGRYCAALAVGVRQHYSFDDEASAFFDFFAEPATDLQAMALAAVRAALDEGCPFAHALPYARLLQHYELSFWNTLSQKRDQMYR